MPVLQLEVYKLVVIVLKIRVIQKVFLLTSALVILCPENEPIWCFKTSFETKNLVGGNL